MNKQMEQDQILTEQQPAAEEPMQTQPEAPCEMPEKESKPRKKLSKKLLILIAAGIVVCAAIAVVIYLQSSVFSRAISAMHQEYPFADNSRAVDDSYMEIDTNPYDRDYDELELWQQVTFERTQSDSIKGIRFLNERFGFSAAVYRKMMETTALMGRQSEENGKYRVSWSYHPSRGLEVMYEKK